MAEPNLQEMVQDIITCSICVEEAEDPRPLACQHTFCLQCLKKYIESKDRQDEIECPVCRMVCLLPNGNVEDLPASFLYTQLKDANIKCTSEKKKETPEDKGTNSQCLSQDEKGPEEGDKTDNICSSNDCGQTAKSFCKTCKFICSECEDEHKSARSLRAHVILTLNEAENLQKNHELPLCSKHHDERLKLFCEDCYIPICSMCFPVDHAAHKCVELINKADREKDKLGQAMKTIKNHLNKTGEMSELITVHSAKLNETANDIKCQARYRSNKIIDAVKCHEEVIIEDVEESNKLGHKILQGEADKINMVQGVLQTLQYSSNQLFLYGSPFELVTKGKSIELTVQDNNPDDVELNLPELDTTEAELKLQDMKTYEELQKDFKKTLDKLKADSEKETINQQKIVSDLEHQLRQEKESKNMPAGGKWKQGTDEDGDLTFECTFSAGIQNAAHPKPGQYYPARTLECWVRKADEGPSEPAGFRMAALLKRAFNERVLFTITSNTVAWHGAVVGSTKWGDEIKKDKTIKRLSALGIE